MLNSFISYIITIYIGSVVGKKTLLTYNDSINFKIHVEFFVMLHLYLDSLISKKLVFHSLLS